ncbi:MAG: hypothetical protein AAF543_13850 [Pseudomonadota bacterium]
MSKITPFTRNDATEVADLYARVFLDDQNVDLDDLADYFRTVYFDTPFRDDESPSLVYRGSKKEIVAFLGVMPRPMRFQGETIKAAIVGNLMVQGETGNGQAGGMRKAPTHGNQLAPAALLKAFFRYPHDLCLNDTAIDQSRRIWERSGGQTIHVYSLRWLRVLKPFHYGLATAEGLASRAYLRPLFGAARPIGALIDRAARSFVVPEATVIPEGCTVDQLRPEDMVDELDACRGYDLVPGYSVSSLAWLMDMSRARRRRDRYRSLAVRQTDGRLLGWAIYAGAPGEIGQTLQFYARQNAVDHVFDCLLHDAAGHGLMALSGKADPSHIGHFSKRRCILKTYTWTIARARRPELLQAFLAGKALFSDLESEGWTRFVQARQKGEFALA